MERQYKLLSHPIGRGRYWRVKCPTTWKYYQWEWWTQVICYKVIMLTFYNSLTLTKSAVYLSDGEFYRLSLGLPLHNVYIHEGLDIWVKFLVLESFAHQTTHSMYHQPQHEYCLAILYVCSKVTTNFRPPPYKHFNFQESQQKFACKLKIITLDYL